MATRKVSWILFGVILISAWALGFVTEAAAETMNYKSYSYVLKADDVPVGDVEGHTVGLVMRRAFYVFESGEVATTNSVATRDLIKGTGPSVQYTTISFEDGSTIIIKSLGRGGGTATAAQTSGGLTSEIIKGTGRFEGIKGTQATKLRFLPVEKGEGGPKGIGGGTITYTLPSK
jgi:hypothetical protein